MWPTDIFAAFLLISAPVDAPVPAMDPADWPKAQFALRETTRHLGLLTDNQLATAVLTDPKLFDGSVRYIRKRWTRLGDAPAKEDLERFPDLKTAEVAEVAWRAHLVAVLGRPRSHPNQAFHYLADVHEATFAVGTWETMKEIRQGRGGTTRGGLKEIRKYVGEDAYKVGRLPPPPKEMSFRPW